MYVVVEVVAGALGVPADAGEEAQFPDVLRVT
jgi:hypothetical protein